MEYNMNIIELIGIIVGSIATILGGVWFMLYKAFNLGKVSHRMEEIEKKTSNADCKTHKESIEKIKEHNLPQRVEQIEKKTLHADCISIKDLIRQHEITFNSIKHCIKSINATLKRHDKYFEKIDKRFSDVDKRFADVDKRFADVNTNIKDITRDVKDLTSDVKGLTGEVKDLTRDVISIKSFLSTKYKEDIDLVSLKNSPTKLSDFGNQILEEINGIEFINDNKECLISRLDEEKPRTALDVENSAFIVFVNFCNNEKFDGIKNFIYNSPEYNVKDNKGCDRKYNLSLIDVCFILSIPLRDMYLESHPEILNNV
jgi:archaellum component FlaC